MKDINYQTVKSYLNESKFHEALQILLEELTDNPDDWNVNTLIGFCYRAMGKYEQSERYYLLAIKLNPNDYSTLLGLGIIYQLKEDYPQAISTLKRAIKLDPSKIEAINSLGFTYKKMGDIKNALVEYNTALETLNNSAFNYLKNNNPEIIGSSNDGKTFDVNPAFFIELRKLLKSNILYSTLMNNIGGCYFDMRQLEKAKECFKESIDFIPDGITYEQPYIGLKNIEAILNN